MGEDGHFASLFPDMINQNEAFDLNASPKILITPPQGNPLIPRITMNTKNNQEYQQNQRIQKIEYQSIKHI